jgi:DHA2 family multidrug resistance protein
MTTRAASMILPPTNSPSVGATAAGADERIDPHRLVAFLAMVFGMFMAILDIQIVSASLTEIQAGLAASSDEISWVQTAYLIAEVIAIPLSGFLSRALGTRALFAISAAGFTAASVMCGLSTSINEIIVWRAIQGFIGGGMIPTVFATAYTIFPRSRQSVITPLIGLVATLALVDFDKPNLRLLEHFDWWGLVFMAGLLGGLEYVLEEGPRNDWLQDDTIALLAAISAVCGVAFFARMLLARAPIVDLGAFANRNFALGSLYYFVLGIGLFGLTYLYPLYLGVIRGYDALMIGQTMFVSGLAMSLTAPIAGRLAAKTDPRFVLMAGFLLFAVGTWQMTWLTKDWDFYKLLMPQVFRGIGMMLAIVPITNVALGTLAPDRVKNASGLFNLMRNLGGAVGLATLNTVLDDRIDLHIARLHEAITFSRGAAVETLANMMARFQSFGSDAPAMALKQLTQFVHQQAAVMAFADVFLLLTIVYVALAAAGVVMNRPAPIAARGDNH